MKKNLLLITVVTVISLAIIAAVIFISAGNSGTSSIPESSVPSGTPSVSTTTSAPETQPPQTTAAPVTEQEPAPTLETVSVESAATPETEGIVSLAQSLIGIEFVDGGDSPETGFDNSGFIYYVLRENGFITCPRGVAAQAEMGTERKFSELRAGDLVYFSNDSVSETASAGFGGIYIGDGKMIACLMPGTEVKEISITNDYYKGAFYRGISLS